MEKQYTVNTGDQSTIYRIIEDYFDNLERRIDEHYDHLLEQNQNLRAHPHFERRVLGARIPEWVPEALRPDDYFHMILYKDKVIAAVTEQRNLMNYVQFSFFDNIDDVLKKSGNA
jgi:hypothetical protein